MPRHVGKIRWWNTNDVRELSLLPNANNGYVYTIVAPAIDYWKETKEGKKGLSWRE
jgi:hypothetical protein